MLVSFFPTIGPPHLPPPHPPTGRTTSRRASWRRRPRARPSRPSSPSSTACGQREEGGTLPEAPDTFLSDRNGGDFFLTNVFLYHRTIFIRIRIPLRMVPSRPQCSQSSPLPPPPCPRFKLFTTDTQFFDPIAVPTTPSSIPGTPTAAMCVPSPLLNGCFPVSLSR